MGAPGAADTQTNCAATERTDIRWDPRQWVCSDGRHENKPNHRLSEQRFLNFCHVQASPTRLLPPGYQQNQMGSAGALPRASAGGDRRVRDGLVRDKIVDVDGCGSLLCVWGRTKSATGQMGAPHAAEQKRKVAALLRTCCFTS